MSYMFGGDGGKLENNKLFVYGILKQGYALDLAGYEATFLGEAHIDHATLYHIGGGVGLRFTEDDTVAHGELWTIPEKLWKWLDHIESNGFAYTRKIVGVQPKNLLGKAPEETYGPPSPIAAWVYEHTYPGMVYSLPIKGGSF